jgi:hypothetical protein
MCWTSVAAVLEQFTLVAGLLDINVELQSCWMLWVYMYVVEFTTFLYAIL